MNEILIILALILLNGFFSMSEIALVSSKKFKLQQRAKNGHKGSLKALELSNDPGKFFSTVQIGITLIGILTGVYGGASIKGSLNAYLQEIEALAPYSVYLATTIVVIVITYFTLILGELFPKRLGLSAPEKIASFMAVPMSFLSIIAKPIVWFLDLSTELIIKLFRIKINEDDIASEDEIRSLMSLSTEVQEEEKEILERVFFLGDSDVGSLMTPRNEVIMIDLESDLANIKYLLAKSDHTNFPVYKGSPDNLVGVLNLKVFTSAVLQDKQLDIDKLLRPILFVTEATKAFNLLQQMKQHRTHFAVAVNEYGSFMGVITSNDLFKVLVGNLYQQEHNGEIVKRADGSFLVDGLISLDDFFVHFKVTDTKDIESKGFYTLGGLILYINNNIPHVGDKMEWRNFTFEVLDMDGQRVDKLLVEVRTN